MVKGKSTDSWWEKIVNETPLSLSVFVFYYHLKKKHTPLIAKLITFYLINKIFFIKQKNLRKQKHILQP